MAEATLGSAHFQRIDETDDALFYQVPRMVTHIDEPACRALSDFYRENLPAGGDLIDLMSSCVSHLPEDVAYRSVTGMGMNARELDANPRLTRTRVQDLNMDPSLPFEDESFDGCAIAVSVQYLVRPIEVFAEIGRVLKPRSPCLVSFSNRMFPTKAVAVWRAVGDRDHARLVGHYFLESGRFEEPELHDLSPNPGVSDPLYMVMARRSATETGVGS
jgi:SAM-dependent methyltransferase